MVLTKQQRHVIQKTWCHWQVLSFCESAQSNISSQETNNVALSQKKSANKTWRLNHCCSSLVLLPLGFSLILRHIHFYPGLSEALVRLIKASTTRRGDCLEKAGTETPGVTKRQMLRTQQLHLLNGSTWHYLAQWKKVKKCHGVTLHVECCTKFWKQMPILFSLNCILLITQLISRDLKSRSPIMYWLPMVKKPQTC